MFSAVYEIRLENMDVKLDHDTWDKIRDRARSHCFFLVEYMGKKYKYARAETFYQRPTRFDFVLANPSDEKIEIIYISGEENTARD